ncbi:phosphonate C-P lyase system protein PhnH [Microvirga sp. VF16]|uniref:phosphonate C-P lyase system protein PhnH n=1 Tax=Microvirga sp. VF16 TaxID=2807101 RepID=UPI00193CFBEF|nr:phosphonate C-P lyase system protein PhnH [Microvirga sp. VF16]QRM32521.1 phosphonate C-P lyase system protein PhnH [Microvirga sp. VF16]
MSASSQAMAAQETQSTFRAVLRAFSYPGEIVKLKPVDAAPAGMCNSLFAAARCLLDGETSVWLDSAFDTPDVRDVLRLQNGVTEISDQPDADFALIGSAQALPNLQAFRVGTLLDPNLSTTLLVQVPSLSGGEAVLLSGPGIKGQKAVAPSGLPQWFWSAWADNASRFPVGLDMILFDDAGLMGLPRSSRGVVSCS